ncbi:beta-ketoacyl-ACP synthase 3 [Paeniglutamicibacter sp. NPDC091659]|uniref:beta-ketoacyl-ACP synthase 3 n=1 Tax=Paeniglutamicibacter sp. NPDC091659 TaxID=3364389 RepID=UPI003823684E
MKLLKSLAGSQVIGFGHYQPANQMTNHDIAKMVDTTDKWIQSRTGIVTRHIAEQTETVADMAAAAGAHALTDASVDINLVDLIIVATTTAADRTPNTAGRVAQALGALSPAIMDINTACSGFCHALAIADSAIRTGSATVALIIASEKLSAVTDWTDRGTCILTADGAGAVIATASDTPRISSVSWGSDNRMTDTVRIQAPGNRFEQDGQTVFRWAISDAAKHANRTIEQAGYTLDDIDVLAVHQANLRIIEPLAKRLGLEHKIVLTDVSDSGNTSAASIPLGLSKWWHNGKIPADALTLLFGFGGGFAYAGQLIRTPARTPHHSNQ